MGRPRGFSRFKRIKLEKLTNTLGIYGAGKDAVETPSFFGLCLVLWCRA